MQHSIILLLGQIALTQPEVTIGHCPAEKQMIVPLSANCDGDTVSDLFRIQGTLNQYLVLMQYPGHVTAITS